MRRGSNNRETPKGVPSSKNNRQLVTCRPFRDSCMRTKPNTYRHGSYRLGRVYRQGSKTLFHAYGPRRINIFSLSPIGNIFTSPVCGLLISSPDITLKNVFLSPGINIFSSPGINIFHPRGLFFSSPGINIFHPQGLIFSSPGINIFHPQGLVFLCPGINIFHPRGIHIFFTPPGWKYFYPPRV